MNNMESLVNLMIGAVLLAVEVVTSLLSAIVPVVRTVR